MSCFGGAEHQIPRRRSVGAGDLLDDNHRRDRVDFEAIVRYDAKVGQRGLDMLRWGLIPYWAKDIKVGFANINAKAEGIESKPAFREAFQRRQ